MNLGICLPYRRCEATTAALRLADLGLSRSANVRLLGVGGVEHGIHPHWDKRVRAVKMKSAIYTWAFGCDYLVWFSHQPQLLKEARLVAGKKPHALVVLWHSLPRLTAEDLQNYDRIICPTRFIHDSFVNVMGKAICAKRLSWCPWDSGLTPIRRTDLPSSEQFNLYVPVDGATMDETGGFTIAAVNEVMSWGNHVRVTLDCAKSWPRKIRNDLKDLVAYWRGRLIVNYQRGILDQVEQLHKHDWTFVPAIRADVGMIALRSLACHVPVLAFDIEPFSSIVSNGRNGLLIRCQSINNWLGGGIAEPHLSPTMEGLTAALADTAALAKMRKADWRLFNRCQAFESFWDREWGC